MDLALYPCALQPYGLSTRCNSVPCNIALTAYLLHMAFLILARPGGGSYGCNTVPIGQSVFIWLLSREVGTTTDVEEAALLAVLMACAIKKT